MKFRAFVGYFWAVSAILVFAIMFIASQAPVEKINSFFNLKVSSRVSGGEINKEIEHEGYKTIIHKPVFEGIFSDRKDGFVQVKWTGQLPDEINEDIDYNNDGNIDFSLKFISKLNEASIEKYNQEVDEIDKDWIFTLKDTKGLRVSLKKLYR